MPHKPQPIFITLTELLNWSTFTPAHNPRPPTALHRLPWAPSGAAAPLFTRTIPDGAAIIILDYEGIERHLNQPPPPTLAPGQLILINYKLHRRQAIIRLARRYLKPIIL